MNPTNETPREREKRLDRERAARRRKENPAYVAADNIRRGLAQKEKRKDEGYRLAQNAKQAQSNAEKRKQPSNYSRFDAIDAEDASYRVNHMTDIVNVPHSARYIYVKDTRMTYKFRTQRYGIEGWLGIAGAARLSTRFSEELWILPLQYGTRTVFVDDEQRFLWLTDSYWAARKVRDGAAQGNIDCVQALEKGDSDDSETWFSTEGDRYDSLQETFLNSNQRADDDDDDERDEDYEDPFEKGDGWDDFVKYIEEKYHGSHNEGENTADFADSTDPEGEGSYYKLGTKDTGYWEDHDEYTNEKSHGAYKDYGHTPTFPDAAESDAYIDLDPNGEISYRKLATDNNETPL